MPSALETLVKILKLEREQGYKNTAVIGGLGAFEKNWTDDAHRQARKPEHHLLVDELAGLMRNYEAMEQKHERHTTVNYMLDRITGRVPPPAHLLPPAGASQSGAEPRPAPPERRPPPARPPRDEMHRGERRDDSPRRERRDERGRPERPERPPRGEGRSNMGANTPRDDAQRQYPKQRRPDSKPPAREQPPRSEALLKHIPEGVPDTLDEPGSQLDIDFVGRPSGPVRLDIPPPPRLTRVPRRPRPFVDGERAAEILRGLSAPVEKMKGVGPKVASLLDKLNIHSISDLLFYLPRRYDDYTQLLPIRRLSENQQAVVIGTVRRAEVRVGRNNRKDFFMVVDDGSGTLAVTFFGMFRLSNQIRVGQQLVLKGTTTLYGGRIQMTNPEWEPLDAENLHSIGIVPVYGLTEGLGPKMLRRLIKQTVDYWADRIPDPMPEAVLERAELPDYGWTIRNLHFPESFDHLRLAKRRFVFDQLIVLQLAMLAQRRTWQAVPGVRLEVDEAWLDEFMRAVFPYELTGAQQRAIADIRGDLGKDLPMNRLLQGDVGSGKTAVATVALAMAVAAGKQAALMVPTGILAEQHYRNISRTFERMPGERKVVVGLLTSTLTSTEREAIYNGLADGSIDIIIGTHAIIQEGVTFKDLAVAVIDEQHRFGVEQRGALRGKGTNPHLLVMTATPIPRTLALTMYADLDLSIIDEMPPGRIPIQTRVIEPVARQKAHEFVSDQLDQGRQAFIVYPLVEASEKIEAESAVEAYTQLQDVFRDYRVGILHGRMKPVEKDEVMAAFGEKRFDVLVTTSVAEVGVDVPNASVMMIEGANRFGLAQLHQFRGRVGRGGHASYCLLVADTKEQQALDRLHALELTTDGFRLAEIDWQLRGPGELVGTRQSGQALVRTADAMTPDLVELAQREARTIFEEDPTLQQEQHRLLMERVGGLRDDRSDVS